MFSAFYAGKNEKWNKNYKNPTFLQWHFLDEIGQKLLHVSQKKFNIKGLLYFGSEWVVSSLKYMKTKQK